MGQRHALIACVLAAQLMFGLPAGAAGTADQGPRWETLSPDMQQVLAPVAGDWDGMPGYQRQRLLSAAKHYPKLSPAEQARFRARLPDWAKLSHEKRKEARETFKKFHALPTEKREAIKQRWKNTAEAANRGAGAPGARAAGQEGRPAPAPPTSGARPAGETATANH